MALTTRTCSGEALSVIPQLFCARPTRWVWQSFSIPTGLRLAVRRPLPAAHDVPPEHQLRVQAAFQAHVDHAVSKTINLPAEATVADDPGGQSARVCHRCKGITVYRHGTKAGQVLTPLHLSLVCPDCLSSVEFAEAVRLCCACGFSSTS